MSPEGNQPGSPADWLRHARSDLELARSAAFPGVLLEALCFHAQQAAEKALKAVLVHQGVPFPKTHNLRILLDRLPPDPVVPPEIEDAASLSDYAVLSRYPADLEPIEEEEYQQAVEQGAAVVAWAENVVQQ